MAIEYRIQKTIKGDFIVRNQADNQLARFATEQEAEAFINRQREENARRDEEQRALIQKQETFNATVPDLNRLQIRWQKWRNWFYSEMTHAGRNTQKFERHLAQSPSGALTLNSRQQQLTEKQEELDLAFSLYGEATTLDIRIKDARNAHDAEALAAALQAADTLIARMGNFWGSAALPE